MVFVNYDIGTEKRANKFFPDRGAQYLPDNNAVFLSIIYGMPRIAREFAILKMRKYPHRILFPDEKGLLNGYLMEKGKVSVFQLEDSNTSLE